MVHSIKREATNPGTGVPSESDVFATLHHLVSRIDAESRADEVVEKAQGFSGEGTQLLVDCLSMALDRDAAPLKTRAHVWTSLIKIASTAKIFARNHTLNPEHISRGDDSTLLDIRKITGEAPVRVKIIKEANTDELYTSSLIGWVHLSHPNILPLYAAFLGDEDHPCLISPYTANQSICDYIQDNPGIQRMPLISDVVNGLSYIHQLDIIHGGLYPESVLISSEGRAVIADLDTSDSLPVRYSAPELLEDDEIQPTKAIDMWALACLCYEVLSGNIPFCQIAKEFKVSVAIAGGNKPNRPGQGGVRGNKIGDAIWQIMLMCWEFEPQSRPACLTVQQVFIGMDIQDSRPEAKSAIQPENMRSSTIEPEQAKTSLTGVLGSDHSPSLRVPEHLRRSLDSFVSDTTRLSATAAEVKKLGPDDTQMFVDFLDLVLEDLTTTENRRPTRTLLSSIMVSTYIIPHSYTVNGVQYDSTLTFECPSVKAYKARGLNARINAVTDSWLVKALLKSLPDWSHVSHPNIIPFYGVFYEDAKESPRLFVVTSFWENGNMEDYALALPQKSRMPLILDVIDGAAYLHNLGLAFQYIKKEYVLISAEGRAVLAKFKTSELFAEDSPPTARILRFTPPGDNSKLADDIWSFGCLCYTVLSRKEPYYQYEEDEEIESAVYQGELPKRPNDTDSDMDEIDDRAWKLIAKCCELNRRRRPTALEVKELIKGWEIEDDRPPAKVSPDSNLLVMRSRPNVNFLHVEALLGKIQVDLLRSPLSKLLQNHIKDVSKATAELDPDDTRILVNFLDLTLKDHLSISTEQNRVLALLSRITSSTHILPQRYELKGIKYDSQPMAEGGYGTIHRGTDIDVCVKLMTQVDPKALTPWIRELILWAHASHPNILPFCGVLLESVNNTQRICLVSPFMKNGNLHNYAPRLPQKSRLPLILDVINGLCYLHGLGIIHSDLKGENVLISNEGRAMITDFGTTQITTATVTATASLVPTTLRFAAPEVVLTSGPPTKERDIWSFGCLCYEVLSQRLPYYQYAQTVQVSAALARKELPKRPSPADSNATDKTDDDDFDDDEEEDWDEIDDNAWNLITKCCAPEPEDRFDTPAVQELIVDMKIWDDRPAAKAVFGAEISKLRANPEIDLTRVAELLDQLHREVVPNAEDGELSFSELFNSLLD
ncbi:hypothetical protein D9756_002592 [Leucocoprinus leucothites]|uniref:Protein kinase domain-containing protein n=1 Tax=Leucocoprinus leucothites TaxID=201217 RepID=A0A8H5GBG9_9AGAR|nr:hypothetical protein D9756_002592 [Leucoagaricus leucothites]